MRPVLLAAAASLLAIASVPCPAADAPAPKTVGWRGNWTGLFPDADGPVTWGRIAKGAAAGMTCQAARPADGAPKSGQPVKDGLPRDWLVIGPFAVKDPVKEFDAEQAAGEADLRPAEGQETGGLKWKRLQMPKKPDYERWGTTELDWVNFAAAFECDSNQIAYAHTYLHLDRPGKVAVVVDHEYGLKAWANGKPVYASATRVVNFGNYVGISRMKQEFTHARSPRSEFALEAGWNRLLFKASSGKGDAATMQFAMRLMDAGPTPYEEKNIVWMTDLGERTNASPVIVGDRIFTPAEPDELVCLDKKTGRILWRTFNNLFEATPPRDRAADPKFKEVEALAAQLKAETDYEKGLALRRKMRDLLIAIDKKKYKLKWDGHLAAHFGIVGFTTTPVSDGKYVYAFFGNGVVACYDLAGTRKWIRRLEAEEVRYSCTPALIGGKLVCVFGGMHGLDAATGETRWTRPEATSIASLIPARIRDTDVIFTRQGVAHRAADGKVLWSNPHIRQGDTGWGAPTVLGDVMYLSWLGITNLIVADFSACTGDDWKPNVRIIEVPSDHRRPNGEWLDRWTAGSPLIYEGTFYGIDQYGVFYAVDLKSGKPLYKQDAGFDEMHTYNHIGVGASAALGGKYIYVIDNQGSCAVLAPGPEYKPVAVNRIETVIPREWPIPPQETLSNAAPVFDGKRMYLRGERYLYCIGEK